MRLNGTVFRIRAEIDGTKYEPGPIKSSEATKITAWTGYGLKEWEAKLVGEGDPLAACALMALYAFRKGENVRFSDLEVDDVDTIEAEFVTEAGEVMRLKLDPETQEPIMVNGLPLFTLDGEDPPDRPTEVGASPTG